MFNTALIVLSVLSLATIASGLARHRAKWSKVITAVLSAVLVASFGTVVSASASSATPQHALKITNHVLAQKVGTPVKVTVSGGSGSGKLTFGVKGAHCSIGTTSGILRATAATSCQVTASKAASGKYESAKSSAVRFTFTSASGLKITNTVLTGEVGVVLTVKASGGQGGAITFNTDGAVCSINSATGALLAGAVGKCPVVATRAASGTFPSISSAPVTFTFGPGPQAAFTISNSVLAAQIGHSITVLTAGGSGPGSVSFTVKGTGCSIDAKTGVLSASSATTCVVTATKGASASYKAAVAKSVTFTFSTGIPQVEDPTFNTPDTATLTSITGIYNSSPLDNTAAVPASYGNFINLYYESTDHWLLNYVKEGSTVTLTWHVTGSYGQVLANTPVTLNANLDYANSTGVAWDKTSLNVYPPNNSGGPMGTLSGTTDANGNVTFTLVNTNSGVPGTLPTDITTASTAAKSENSGAGTGAYDWSRMDLQVGSDVITANPNTTVNQASSLVDIIVVPSA